MIMLCTCKSVKENIFLLKLSVNKNLLATLKQDLFKVLKGVWKPKSIVYNYKRLKINY